MFAEQDQTTVSALGDQPYSLKRYVNETRRLYRTMDKALAKNASGYLIGDHVSIADIAIWPWATAFSKFFEVPRTEIHTADSALTRNKRLILSVLQSTAACPKLTSSLTSRSGCTDCSHVLDSRRAATCRILMSTSSSTSSQTRSSRRLEGSDLLGSKRQCSVMQSDVEGTGVDLIALGNSHVQPTVECLDCDKLGLLCPFDLNSSACFAER